MNEMLITLLITTAKAGIIMMCMIVAAALMILADRRLSAFMQDRLGPNRVGPEGFFQPIADLLKLIFKEDFTPDNVDKPVYYLAPVMILIPALIVFAVIPFGSTLTVFGRAISVQIADLNIGILYIFAIASLGVYGIVLGGWAGNNKYSLFGALRASAQMISYELALGLSVIGVLMVAESVRLNDVIAVQSHYLGGVLPSWNVFTQPLAFVIFVVAMFAETNRLPFDLVEAEQELVGGYHTEYTSMKFAFFFLAEYTNMVTASALATTLFLGGWHLPWLEFVEMPALALELLQIGAFIAKMSLFLLFFVVIRWTLPRFKYNQLMNIGWKVMLPAALVNVVVTSVIIAFL